jgi:hypothetical protein
MAVYQRDIRLSGFHQPERTKIIYLFPFKFYDTKIELNDPFVFSFANIRGDVYKL